MNIRHLAVAAFVAAAAPAFAATTIPLTLNATYWSVAAGGSGDFETQCCSLRPNMVAANLGPTGLPVFTPDGGPAILGVNANNEILWWRGGTTPGGDVVTFTGTGTVTTPFIDGSMFPPNADGTNNDLAFLTARYTGSFTLAQAATVTALIGADDDAFVFVNGVLLAGLGGVHANAEAPVGSRFLGVGEHTVAVFYADRFRTQASLNFDLQAAAVPEPATWAMLIAGFGMVGFAMRRRRTAAA